ncbi:hypothetical protein C9374_003794 [Naegleria lovaniensis]|uniref:Uncharacterized protein n=1 Tax=Naegleria lovaniensis TaxID=51637 RepID=A0AA88KYH5_NAELO|nr:uncharacterized protein C9374_003794 [Naegleria lovaniensis]KAG2394030.1 hypothetical protein C9374_003794 [Naegleria lovaniensis]
MISSSSFGSSSSSTGSNHNSTASSSHPSPNRYNYQQAIRDGAIRSMFMNYLNNNFGQEPLEFIDRLDMYRAMYRFVNNSLMKLNNNKAESNNHKLQQTVVKGSQKKSKRAWLFSDSSVFINQHDINTRQSIQKSITEVVITHPNMESIIKILFKQVIDIFTFGLANLSQNYTVSAPSLHAFVELFYLVKKNDLLVAGQEEQMTEIINRCKPLEKYADDMSKQILRDDHPHDTMLNDTTSPQASTNDLRTPIMLSEIFRKLHPVHLLIHYASGVHYDLALEFHSFVINNRNEFEQHIEKRGKDFKESLLLNRTGLDLQESDLRNPKFKERHIHLGYALEEDSEHWEQLALDSSEDVGLQCYISKKKYVLDPSRNFKGMKLVKMVIDFKFPLEDVWSVYWSGDDHKILDSQAFTENYCVHYQPPSKNKVSEDGSHRFGFVLGRSIINTNVPVLQKRCFNYSMTTIRDVGPNGCDTIMNLGHSVNPDVVDDILEGHLSEEDRQKHKKYILTTGLFYHIFIRVGNNHTKYVHICYLDMDIPFLSGKLFRNIWKRRAKLYRKTYMDLLNGKTDNGKKSVNANELTDSLLFKKPMDDQFVEPTWYNDFKNGVERFYDIENYNVKLTPELQQSLEEITRADQE